MLFSGKITNSFLIFLTRQGADLELLWDLTDLPAEFLRDPSSWLQADAVEKFLSSLDREYGVQFSPGPLVSLVGHQCNDLRAWGVLDSVLKMMQKPEDIYSHPHRFLSYFVSPAPPIANMQRDEGSLSFDIPILTQEYPFVTEYLRSALETLPKYLGVPPAHVQWKNTQVKISWSDNQPSFLDAEDLQTNVRPEFMDSLVHSLENAQRQLEEEKRRSLDLENEIQELKKQLQKPGEPGAFGLEMSDLDTVETSLLKMRDYFSRAHQLVTLLVKQDRMDPQVREAMRRVDWEVVGLQFPHSFSEALLKVRKLKKQSVSGGEERAAVTEALQNLDINEVVEEALKTFSTEGGVQIDRAFLMDRPVRVNRKELMDSLTQVFKKMRESSGGLTGAWTIITRPRGKRAEIEIARSAGKDLENLAFTPDWSELENRFKSKKWSMDVTHHPEVGSSLRLQIPIQ